MKFYTLNYIKIIFNNNFIFIKFENKINYNIINKKNE